MATIWIIGSGIAGMSAAHALANRGLGKSVHVLEASPEVGGLARSKRIQIPGSTIPVATEHSWRIYGHGYKVLRAIMAEIPRYRNPCDPNSPISGTVIDNLVEIRAPLMVQMNGQFFNLRDRLVKSLGALTDPKQLPGEEDRAAQRLLYALTSSSVRIDRELRGISWHQFLGGRALSPRLNDLMVRFYVGQVLGEDQYKTSASSMQEVLEDMLVEPSEKSAFSVMGGPTNEAFLDHWKRSLEARGVKFHLGASAKYVCIVDSRLVAIALENGRLQIAPDDQVVWATSVHALTKILADSGYSFPTNTCLGMLPELSARTKQDALGIQLFMNERLLWPRSMGNIIFAPLDSPWQFIIEPQSELFSRNRTLGMRGPAAGNFADVWAMTLCDPYTPGDLIKKTWPNCSFSEVMTETWHQFTRNMRNVLRGTVTGKDWPNHALARAVPWQSYYSSAGLLVTTEPKTSPNAGTWNLRPGPICEFSNVVLAGDYVRNGREITRMESAARSGTLAAAIILARKNIRPRGRIFEVLFAPLPARPYEKLLGPIRLLDQKRVSAGLPHPLSGIGAGDPRLKELLRSLAAAT